MADPADPSGRGSKDGGNLSSHSSEGGDPSDRDHPRHESLLGRDSATEEPMEGVEASGSTSPRPKTGKVSSPQGGLPAPGIEEDDFILSINASDEEEFLSAGEQPTQSS